MAPDNGYSRLMSTYIERKAREAAPNPTPEREVVREVSFAHIAVDYTGRGMELPTFNFVSVSQDDQGPFATYSWGYSSHHHSVTPPVLFIDRRRRIVDVTSRNQQILINQEHLGKRSAIEAEIADLDSQIATVTERFTTSKELLLGYEQDLAVAKTALETRASSLTADQERLLKAIISNNTAQLELISPEVLETILGILGKQKTRMESVLAALPKPQGDLTHKDRIALDQLRDLFFTTKGSLREVDTKLTTSKEAATRSLEITDIAEGAMPNGVCTFVAEGHHYPKPFPLAAIALGDLMTWTALQPQSLFPDEETIGSMTKKQNGIYRYIHFSSGTGRHSGWGYLSAVPQQ